MTTHSHTHEFNPYRTAIKQGLTHPSRAGRPTALRSPLRSPVDPPGVPAPPGDAFGRQRRPVQRRSLFLAFLAAGRPSRREVGKSASESVNPSLSSSDRGPFVIECVRRVTYSSAMHAADHLRRLAVLPDSRRLLANQALGAKMILTLRAPDRVRLRSRPLRWSRKVVSYPRQRRARRWVAPLSPAMRRRSSGESRFQKSADKPVSVELQRWRPT